MSLKSISFFTPIRYGHQPTSFRQKMTEIVDAYFHLRGRVAVVIQEQKTNDSDSAKLAVGRTIWWHSVLKVTSYTVCFLNLFIATQFPALTSNRQIVQLQTVVGCFPFFMLIAKIILRSTSHVHLSQQIKNEREDVVPDTDLISRQLKATLDTLFGGQGSVDRLPTLPVESGGRPPSVGAVTDPIMKGVFNNKGSELKSFIVIKMRCLSSKKELIEKSRMLPIAVEHFDFSKPIERVLTLFQACDDLPLMWCQFDHHSWSADVCPYFFNSNFTFPEDGTVSTSQSSNFLRLQKVIKEGSGEDLNGIRWEIIGHNKQS